MHARLSTRQQDAGEVILQIPSLLCLTSHYEVINADIQNNHMDPMQ